MIYFGTQEVSYISPGLSEWLPEIQQLDRVAKKTFVFANNYGRRQSISIIGQLRIILD